ncbi:hypothetical protein C6P77_03855 [Burkholderia ambifaria]|nr:hypothetical protein C6P77_03855 [Burkholderia ambifaria]
MGANRFREGCAAVSIPLRRDAARKTAERHGPMQSARHIWRRGAVAAMDPARGGPRHARGGRSARSCRGLF